jgi:diguanylate cyclase
MGRSLWEGLVRPALARLSAPSGKAGPGETTHPAAAYLREITVSGARLMWQEREARAADLRQRILRSELTRRGEQTARALLVDPLTGLGNRRRLEHELAAQAHRLVLFVDIDSFKEVNDVHGHGAGDEVLRRAARALRGCCRDEDVVVRYGGDEFVVLVDAAAEGAGELEAGRRLGERMLERVRSTDWSDIVGGSRISVSVGVGRGQVETALRRADAALLEAKRTGRDTLVVLTA